MAKPSKFDLIEAYDEVRRCAAEVLHDFKATKAGDSYRYVGAMNDVENLRNAVEVVEAMLFEAAP